MALGLGRTAGWWQSPAGAQELEEAAQGWLGAHAVQEGSREVVCPTSCGETKGDVSVKPPGPGQNHREHRARGRGAVRMPRSPSASSAPQACNCDQYLKVSKDMMKQLVRLSVHLGGPGGASEWGSMGSVGRGPATGCSWADPLGPPGRCPRAGGWPVLRARKGTEASGPLDLGSWSLPSPQWALLSHPAPLVECTRTHAPFRQRHMLSGTCTLTRLPVHAQPCAHTCSPAGPCTTGLAKQQSERWGTWAPGRQASPGCRDQGPSLTFPVWRAGGNGSRASWDSPRGEPEHRVPRAPLHSWCPWVPSSLLVALALPASLKGFGPPTRWVCTGDGQCPALSSSLPSAARLQLA